MSRDDEQFIQQARAALDRDAAEVSPHVAERLRQARHAAIAAPYRRATPMWMPALSTAMLLLLAVTIAWFAQLPQGGDPVALPQQQVAGDFEMLVHGEDLELFADLDFYLWLEQQGKHAG